jgi:uncharacterized membrane protein
MYDDIMRGIAQDDGDARGGIACFSTRGVLMQTLFPGIHAMDNVHPLLVHFPIALFVLAFVFQGIVVFGKRDTLQKFSSGLLYLGVLMAAPTLVAGWLASDQAEKLPGYTPTIDRVETIHSALMFVVGGLGLLLAILTYLKRRNLSRKTQWVLFGGLLVLVTLLGIGADRGGQLVYQFGVGGERMVGPPPAPHP